MDGGSHGRSFSSFLSRTLGNLRDKLLGLGMAWVLVPLVELRPSIPTDLCGLRPLVLVHAAKMWCSPL